MFFIDFVSRGPNPTLVDTNAIIWLGWGDFFSLSFFWKPKLCQTLKCAVLFGFLFLSFVGNRTEVPKFTLYLIAEKSNFQRFFIFLLCLFFATKLLICVLIDNSHWNKFLWIGLYVLLLYLFKLSNLVFFFFFFFLQDF